MFAKGMRLISQIPLNITWIKALFWINILGTAYGFYWYHDQLATVRPLFWPVVPDSPGSALLMALFLLTLLKGREGSRRREWSLLSALAFLSNLKYGLWTPAIMVHYWLQTSDFAFDTVHLSLSHLGMAVQAAIFLPYYNPPIWAKAVAACWLLFNDIVDYVFGFHPTLPLSGQEGFAGFAAICLSLFALVFSIILRRK